MPGLFFLKQTDELASPLGWFCVEENHKDNNLTVRCRKTLYHTVSVFIFVLLKVGPDHYLACCANYIFSEKSCLLV